MGNDLNLTVQEINDINSEVVSIIGSEAGSTGERLELWLKNELPDLSDEQIKELIQQFISISATFKQKVDSFESPEEAQEELRTTIKTSVAAMSTEETVQYLVSLRYAVRLASEEKIKQMLNDGIVSIDAIKEEISKEIQENLSGEQIDQLIDEIIASDYSVALLTAGNEEFIDILRSANEDNLFSISNSVYTSAEGRMVNSAVIYAMARNGKLSCIPPDVDPNVIGIYVNAGIEQSLLLGQLAAGEISEEQANTRLAVVGEIIKYLISGVIIVSLTIAVTAVVVPLVASVCGTGIFGFIVAFVTTCSIMDIILDTPVVETIINGVDRVCNFIYEAALKPIGSFVKKVFGKITDKRKGYA